MSDVADRPAEVETDRVEQYKVLCEDGRHYDQKLWIIQSAAYTFTAFFYSALFQFYDKNGWPGVVVAFLNILVFGTFLVHYVKDRAFQLRNQRAIDQLQTLLPGMLQVPQYSGELGVDSRDTRVVKLLKKWSATDIIIDVMVAIFAVDVFIAVFLAFRLGIALA